MPRPKSFDPEEALLVAMRVFWKRGYAATSIRNLTEAMGINKFSLYATYGSKRELFAAALDGYRDGLVSELLSELEGPGAGVDAIRRYFECLVEGATTRQECAGCLMTNTAIEMAGHDVQIRRRVRAHLKRIRRAMLSALDRSVKRGELSPKASTEALSRHLTAASQSLAVAARTRPDREEFDGYVAWLIGSLEAELAKSDA